MSAESDESEFETQRPLFDEELGYATAPVLRKGKSITVTCASCKVDMAKRLPDGTYTYSFHIPKSSTAHTRIVALDAAGVETVDAKNASWFKNSLGREKIEEMFRPSMTIQNSLVVSDVVSDGTIELGQELMIDLSLVGILIYPKSFGLKWKLTSFCILNKAGGDGGDGTNQDDGMGIGEMGDMGADVDKEGIEAFWENKIATVKKVVAKRISGLKKKIGALRRFEKEIEEVLAEAKLETSPEAAWDAKLTALNNRIWDFEANLLPIRSTTNPANPMKQE
jgi:hypothetical protein